MPAGQVNVATAVIGVDEPQPLTRLAERMGPDPFSLVLLFISPEADLVALARDSQSAFPGARVAGCTTSGEVTPAGYQSGSIVAVGFPAEHFAGEAVMLSGLSRLSAAEIAMATLSARQGLARDHGHLPTEFAILLVDGLSIREDELAAALSAGAGAMPLVGGSAGDGTRFEKTFVLCGGRLHHDAAVLCMLRGNCGLRSFSFDHLEPTDIRMVVTCADSGTRTVRQINAEPAAREYSRLVGCNERDLDTRLFAANPLVVRMGNRHHVRAIQRVTPEGGIVFFSAIDEGVVLSLARPRNLVGHLDAALSDLGRDATPLAILAFDCILRRIEAESRQQAGLVAQLLRRHSVVGFNTYGEQMGPLHLNQTFSGFAFFPPTSAGAGAR